jgi:hypothetical protein
MQLSDSLMDPTRMISIAKALKDTDLNKIAFVQYPTAYVDGGGAVEPSSSAELVNTALQNDLPVTFDPAALESDFASVGDPNAVAAAPVEAPAEEAPAEEVPADPAADPATPTTEVLPSDVTGQTAAETRCSAGRTLDDQ